MYVMELLNLTEDCYLLPTH